jgi:hypothetical protein
MAKLDLKTMESVDVVSKPQSVIPKPQPVVQPAVVWKERVPSNWILKALPDGSIEATSYLDGTHVITVAEFNKRLRG